MMVDVQCIGWLRGRLLRV